jgi:hypothetical protein
MTCGACCSVSAVEQLLRCTVLGMMRGRMLYVFRTDAVFVCVSIFCPWLRNPLMGGLRAYSVLMAEVAYYKYTLV